MGPHLRLRFWCFITGKSGAFLLTRERASQRLAPVACLPAVSPCCVEGRRTEAAGGFIVFIAAHVDELPAAMA